MRKLLAKAREAGELPRAPYPEYMPAVSCLSVYSSLRKITWLYIYVKLERTTFL